MELRRCRDARGWVDMHRRRAPLPGDVDAAPEETRPIAGSDLRDAAVAAIYAARRPVNVAEIYRMLCSWGVAPAGNRSRTISDALRAPVAAGDHHPAGERGVPGAPAALTSSQRSSVDGHPAGFGERLHGQEAAAEFGGGLPQGRFGIKPR